MREGLLIRGFDDTGAWHSGGVGVAPPLSAVLAVGNVTGGTDLIVSNGDVIAWGTSGTDLVIQADGTRARVTTGELRFDDDITTLAWGTDGDITAQFDSGGNFLLFSSIAVSGAGVGTAGYRFDVQLRTNNAGGAGLGGSVEFYPGSILNDGIGIIGGTSGRFRVVTGSATAINGATSGASGEVSLQTGVATDSASGDVVLQTGDSNYAPGSIWLGIGGMPRTSFGPRPAVWLGAPQNAFYGVGVRAAPARTTPAGLLGSINAQDRLELPHPFVQEVVGNALFGAPGTDQLFELGGNGTSVAPLTFEGGVRLTTAGMAPSEIAVVQPAGITALTPGRSGFNAFAELTAAQKDPAMDFQVSTFVPINNQRYEVGLRPTPTAMDDGTDNTKAILVYDSSVGPNWLAVVSVNGVDTVTDTGIEVVVATQYHGRIEYVNQGTDVRFWLAAIQDELELVHEQVTDDTGVPGFAYAGLRIIGTAAQSFDVQRLDYGKLAT